MTATESFYRVAYRIGFHPWEDAEEHAPFIDTISALFDREERGREPPYGRALDLGCGSGVWTTRLARRGREVTDVIPSHFEAPAPVELLMTPDEHWYRLRRR